MKIDSCVDNFVYFMLLWSSTSICWRQLYFLRLLWRHTATTLTPPHTPTHTPTHAHNYRYTIQSASRASSVMSRYLLESSLVSTRAGFTARQIITRHSRTSSPPVVCDDVYVLQTTLGLFDATLYILWHSRLHHIEAEVDIVWWELNPLPPPPPSTKSS